VKRLTVVSTQKPVTKNIHHRGIVDSISDYKLLWTAAVSSAFELDVDPTPSKQAHLAAFPQSAHLYRYRRQVGMPF